MCLRDTLYPLMGRVHFLPRHVLVVPIGGLASLKPHVVAGHLRTALRLRGSKTCRHHSHLPQTRARESALRDGRPGSPRSPTGSRTRLDLLGHVDQRTFAVSPTHRLESAHQGGAIPGTRLDGPRPTRRPRIGSTNWRERPPRQRRTSHRTRHKSGLAPNPRRQVSSEQIAWGCGCQTLRFVDPFRPSTESLNCLWRLAIHQ